MVTQLALLPVPAAKQLLRIIIGLRCGPIRRDGSLERTVPPIVQNIYQNGLTNGERKSNLRRME
jgi:hypothetical protein